MYLIFDTETTGLPKSKKSSFLDVDNWPRIVQIAWLQLNKNFEPVSKGNFLIKPDGFEIPNDAIVIHGITNKEANEKGESINDVLNIFTSTAGMCKYLIGHNVEFDLNILLAEMFRYDSEKLRSIEAMKSVCTMKTTTELCGFERSPNKLRWPKLHELYKFLFDKDMEGAHDAMNDVQACASCFVKLIKTKVIAI